MYILGISAFYHDSASCLIKDGEIIAAAQEERFTRIKHDNKFPELAINFCLNEEKIKIKDIELVVFYENPGIKFNRIIDTFVHAPQIKAKDIEYVLNMWLNGKLYQEKIIAEKLGYKGKIIFPLHHESHAASAFFPSPFNQSAILTLDGVGEWMTTTIGVGKDNKINLLKKINFPHSLGMLYSAFTYYVGFKVNSGEYKLMGLAPYGNPEYVNLIKENLIDIKEDGSFRVNMKYFDFAVGDKMINNNFRKLFGMNEREPESEISEFYMNIAKSIQVVIEEIILKIAVTTKKLTGLNNLCLAGGVALNCVANGKILKENIFKNIWIQPASGDAGGALGAALYGWHQYLNNPRKADNKKDSQKGSLLGPQFDERYIENFLNKSNAVYKKLSEEELVNKIAELILEEKVIGHFAGRMEFGPRALGNRSILGDARSPRLQKVMNLKIKFRESFRPFAPSVTEENSQDFFNLDTRSPYMLITVPIKEEIKIKLLDKDVNSNGFDQLDLKRSLVPAITHVDYSARVQTVSFNDNPRFYAIIKKVGKKTGIPILINTSFNVRGEPIVCTPQDAYNTFMNTNIDYLVLENILLSKIEQPNYKIIDKIDGELD